MAGEPDSVTSLETLKTDDVTSDDNLQSPTIKKKQRMNGEKTCRVCGDRALAHNFDVISCESCKAFFRRNALKTKIRPCAFNGDCEITPNTRRFCADCRLRKCLQSGMRADMILDADERKARQDKLTENRRRREALAQQQQKQHHHHHHQNNSPQHKQEHDQELPQQPTSSSTSSPPSFQEAAETKSSSSSPDQTPSQRPRSRSGSRSGSESESRSRSESESRSRSGSRSCCSSSSAALVEGDWVIPPPSTASRGLRGSAVRSEFLERAKRQATLLDFSLLMPPSRSTGIPGPAASAATTHNQQQQNNNDDYPQHFIDTSFQHVPTDQLPSDLHKYWRLQDEERSLLMELTIAYQETVLKLPAHMDSMGPVNVQSILSRCQRFARDIVDFVKRVPDFRALRVEDQVAALKGASWRTFLVKSSANFVVERNAWIKDDGYLSVEQFAEASPEHRDRILLLARYSAALKNILRNDPTTFAVLQILVLFDPRDPNLSDRQLVSQMADRYGLLLKHLLQAQWSYDFAGHYLSAVRGKVEEMGWVADSIQVMFQDWLHLLEPLMREVLNLT